LACHNRRQLTHQCINSLEEFFPSNWSKSYVVTDDGSCDGTSEMLNSLELNVRIVQGNGKWFWAKSMNQAMLKIEAPSDVVLLINDDVHLDSKNFPELFKVSVNNPNAVLVGQTRSRLNGDVTYGGFLRTSRHPLRLMRLEAINVPVEIETFNANFVWIPWNIFLEAGPLDGKFSHSLADIDYGYRLGNMGIEILAIPGNIGVCEKNLESPNISRLNLLRSQFSAKKLSVRNLSKFYFRYARFDLAFVYLISTYLKVILRIIFK